MRLAVAVLSIGATSLVATCRLQDIVNPGQIHGLQLAPSALVDTAKAGSLTPRVTKLVIQVGTEAVPWSLKAMQGSAWLQPNVTSGTAPDTITVALDPSALVGGVYHDTLLFTVASIAVAPVRVPVEFDVTGCTVAPIALGATVTDSLTGGDCAAPHRAGRVAKLYTFSGNANDSVSLRVIPAAFAGYLVLDTGVAVSSVPSFAEGSTCRAGQTGACLTYVRLPRAGNYEVEVTSASGTAATGPYTLSFNGPRPPVPADTLTQLSSNGLTIVPAGGTITQDTIGLRAYLADADSDSVRVDVEVQPLATAFTGTATASSPFVPSGGRAVATVTGLANFATYHWQARAVDRTGRSSAWVAFAGGAAGFKLNVPQPPNAATGLAQLKSNGTTAIAIGGTTNEATVLFQGTVTDPDTTLQLRLDVEVQPVGTAFTNLATASSTPVANGRVATATVSGLQDNKGYHWQARAVDQGGHAGAWASFGGNAESAPDFNVALPPAQLVVITEPAADTSGSAVAPAVRVAAQDALGNTLTSYTGTITATLAANPSGGTLTGTASVAAVAGVATFSNLLIDKAGAGYALRFSAGALATTSTAFPVVPGPASAATSLVLVSSGTVASGSAVTLTLQARDAAGNNLTVGGSTVAFSELGGASTGTIGATTDSANGKYVATFTGVKSGTATTIHATLGGVAVTSTGTVTVTPGPVSTSQSVVTVSSGIVASGVAATLTLQAKDAAGNNLTGGGLTVAFTASGGTSTGTVAGTTDNANGTYTSSFTGVTAGTPDTIHATIGGVAVTSLLPTIQVTSSSTVSASMTTVVAAPTSITASTGTSTATITVTAKDAAGNPVSNVMVTLAATGTGNTIVQPVGATNASGVATGTFSSTATGPHTVSANAGGVLANQQPVVTVTPAAAASLAFLVQPVNVSAGATITPPVQVEVLDGFGNVATNATGTVSLALTVPAGATLTGGGPATVTNGVATFAALTVNRVGTYSLTPSTTVSGVTTLPASASFAVTTAQASQLVWTQQPGSVVAGATMTPVVTVSVEDPLGNVVTTASGTVTLGLTGAPAGVTLTGGGAATVTNGVATFSGLSINKTGTFTLTPSTTVSGVTTLPASASFSVTPGAATQLAWSQQPTNVVAGATMSPAVTVTVQDANGNTVTGASGTVTLGLTGSPAGVTLTGGGAAAVASGVATFAGLGVNRTGSYTLTPATTVAGVTTLPASASFAVSPGAAAQVGFTTQPSAVGAGAPITPAVTVAVQDAQGNTVPTATNSITIAIGTNPGGGTLSGTLTAAAAAGVATFANLSIDKAAPGYTLTAAATGLTGAVSSAFTVNVGGATKVGFTVQPSNVVAGVAIAPAVVAAVQDAQGNTVGGATNTITIAIGTNPGGGTLSGTVSAAAVNGVATFSTLSINKTGTGYTLAASATGLTTGTSGTFNVTPAATTKLAFTTQPPNTTGGTAFTVVVTAQDALGNTATGFTGTDTVAIGTNPGGGTLSGTAVVAAVAGVATYSNLSIDKAGTGYTLTAKSGALAAATSNTFNITTGGVISAAQSTVAVSSALLTASGGNVTDTITVTVKDAQGNPIPGVTVALSVSGTANVVQPTGPTDATGVATGRFSSTVSGTHTVSATAGGVTITQQPVVTVNPTAAASLAFAVQPSNVASNAAIAPAVQVAVRDTFNNLVPTATNSVFIQFLTNPSGGVLSGTTTVTAAAGVATFSTLSVDKVGTGYSLFASTAGLTGAASGTFNVTPAAAAKVAFTTQPTNVGAAAAISPAVVVTVQDAAGNTVTSSTASVTVAIGTNPGGGTLGGTVTVAAASGVATFSTLTINKAGSGYTLTAASSGLAGATSSTFTVSPGAATQLVFTQQPTNVAAGTAISPAVTVTVEDAQGNVVTGASGTVTLGVTGSPAGVTLANPGPVTVTNGVATFASLSVNKTGTYTLTPTTTVSGVATLPASSSFTVGAGVATQLSVTTQPPGSIAAAAAFGLVVTALDSQGNTATGFTGTVTVAIGTNPGGGTLTGTASVAAVAGVATFSGLSINKAGNGYTLNVTTTATGVTGTATTAFNVVAGAASKLAFATEPSTVVAGSSIAPAVVVAVQDANGNTVTTANNSIALAIGTNPGGGTLLGGGAITAASGLATFSTLSINKVGTGYTLSATSSGLTTGTSAAFNVTPGLAAQLIVTTQPPASTAAGAPFGLVVTAQDANGNTATGFAGTDTVAIGANPGGGTLSGTLTAVAASGVATFSGLSINRIGTGYTLVVRDSALTVTSSVFNITSASATQLAWTQQPSNVVAGASMSPAVTVTVEDAQGNVVTGASGTVTLGITGSPAGVTVTNGTATVTNGVATFSTLSLNKVGTYTFTPATTVSGVTTLPASGSFSVSAGAATQLVWTQQPTNVASGANITPAVTVTVEDANGNTVTTASGTVTLSVTGSPAGVTLTGGGPATVTNGVATFAAMSVNKAGTYTLTPATTVSGVTTLPASASFTVGTGGATQLVWSQQPTNVVASATMSPAVTVTVEDASGNVVTTASGTVTLGVTGSPAGVTLTGGGAATVTNGVATFAGLSVNKVGTYTLTPTTTVSGVTTLPASGSFTVSPGAAKQLAWTQQPTNVVAGAAISPAVVVTVEDSDGNTVTTASGTVTLGLTGSPAGVTLTGGGAATVTNGVATFAALSVNKVGTYTLTPATTVSGVTTLPASGSFTVSPGAATELAWTQQPTNVASGGTMSPAVTVTVEDANGNTVTTASGTVTLSLTAAGGAILTGGGPATVTNGVATFATLSVNKAGTYTFTPATTVSGVTTLPASGSFTVSTGGATQLVWTQQPTNVVAAATMSPAVTVTVEDAQGNVVTTASGTVTLGLTGSPAGVTLTGGGAATVTNGVATFAGLSVNKVGTYTLTPTTTVSGVTTLPASGSFAVSPGTATALVFSTEPPSTTAGTAFTVVVTAQDGQGNTATGFVGTVSVAIGTNPGGGTLSGTTSVAASSGVATFSGLSINRTGNGYTLTASATGVTGATSTGFNITTGGTVSASVSTVTAATGTLTASNGNLTDLVTVTVKDALGNPIQGVTVSLSATGTSNLVQPSGPTDAAGVTTGTFSSTAAGNHTITATAGGVVLTQQPVVTVNPTAAAGVAFSVGPSNVVSAASISPAVQVAVRDTFNNPVTTASNSITVALFNNPGGGTLSGTLTQAASSGIASFSNLSIDKTGTGYTLAATSSGLTGAISGSFNVTPAAASKLAFSGQPSNVVAGSSISPAVTVTVQDAQGNTVTGSSASITVAIGTNPGGGTLGGTLTQAASGGIATFANLSINKTGNGYTLGATSGSLTPATSTGFNVTPGAASAATSTVSPSPASITANGAATSTLTVQLKDANGNNLTAAGGTVTFLAPSQGSIGAVTDNGNGTYTATYTAGTAAGAVTITPQLNGTSFTNTGTVTLTAGAATKLVITTQPPASGTSGVALAPATVVQVEDAFNNIVDTSGVTVSASLNVVTGSPVLGGTTSAATGGTGAATFNNLIVTGTPSSFTLTFAASGLASATSTTVTQ